MSADDTIELRKRVATANKVIGHLYNVIGLGHVQMPWGHVSARIAGRDGFVVKGRPSIDDSMIKSSLFHIVTVALDGNKLDGSDDVKMPNEIQLHCSIYKARKDVAAICHAHPRYTILASFLDTKLKPMCNQGLDLFPIPVYKDNAIIRTEELAKELVLELGDEFCCLLRGHGAVTLAGSPEKAVLNMLYLEEQARLNVLARMTLGRNYTGIPHEQVERFLDSLRDSLEQPTLRDSERNLWDNLVEQADRWRWIPPPKTVASHE